MIAFCKPGRAIQAGLGLALVAAFAFANGCASPDPAGESEQFGEEPIGEDTEAIMKGIYRCASRATADASLVVKRDKTCTRYDASLPGASGSYCPKGGCQSCLNLSRKLGCFLISTEGAPLDLDARSHIYSCTLGQGAVSGALVVKPDQTCARYGTPLVGASKGYCFGGTCPSCWSLARDIKCLLIP
jgi:hypothetical protein